MILADIWTDHIRNTNDIFMITEEVENQVAQAKIWTKTFHINKRQKTCLKLIIERRDNIIRNIGSSLAS